MLGESYRQAVRHTYTLMEVFGILFSVPLAAVATLMYSVIVARVRWFNRGRPLAVIRRLSTLALVLIAAEILACSIVGAVQARAMIGPTFVVIHLMLFFLGVPSLSNLFVLGKDDASERWKYAIVPCTALAFVLVMMNIYVSEALYGIDGQGGPYSSTGRSSHVAWVPAIYGCRQEQRLRRRLQTPLPQYAPRNTASTSVGMSHCFWFSPRTAATASPRASNSSAFLGNGFRFIIIFASFWARFNFAPYGVNHYHPCA